MIYKNSMKLLTSNFSLVWKQLAFTLIRLAIIIGLTILVSSPIIKLLGQQNFWVSLTNLTETFYTNPAGLFESVRVVLVQFFTIIGSHMSTLWYSVILFFFVITIVNSFLKSVGKFTMTCVAHSELINLNHCGYCHTLISNTRNIFKFAGVKILYDMPFLLLKCLYIALYCSILNSIALAVIGITILVVIYTLIYALQISMYSGCAVSILNKKNPFKCVTNTYSTQKGFAKVFSNSIVIVLTIIVVNVFIGIFTFGAGLIITVPASMVLITLFELISYYSQTKQRYYLSPTLIVDTDLSNKIN